MTAGLVVATLAGCGGKIHEGQNEQGKVDPALSAAAATFAATLSVPDSARLRASAAHGWKLNFLGDRVAHYGGHPVRAVDYDGHDANMSSVGFAVKCSPTKTVTVWQPFAYERGKWRPILGDLPHPSTETIPAASVPAAIAGSPSAPATC